MSEKSDAVTDRVFEALNFDLDRVEGWQAYEDAKQIVADAMSDAASGKSDSLLSLPMDDDDSGAKTLRGWFRAVLTKLWEEEEGFSGKRPFGNSGWAYDLYKPLVAAGKVTGTIDEYGDLGDFDRDAANQLIFDAIEEL